MKTFKVKETFLVTGWTYVKAETQEEAEEKLNQGYEDNFKEEDYRHEETFWKTFQET